MKKIRFLHVLAAVPAFLLLTLAAAGTVVVFGCATQPGAADLAAAKELDRQFADAMSRKDLGAAMACFWKSPDLVVVVFGDVARGPEKVQAGIAQLFFKNASVKLTVNEAAYVPAGSEIVTYGTATYMLTQADGTFLEIRERWTDVKRKIAGRWVYVLDHASIVP